MNIFKNKSVIRLYAFVTACFIVITLLLSGIDVCAEELSLIDLLNIQDVFITRSDLGDGNYVSFFDDTTYEETYHNLYNNGFEYTPNEAVLGQLNSGDFVNYLGCFNGNFTQFTLFYLPEDAFAVQNNSSVTIYTSHQYSDLGGGYRAGFPIFKTSDFTQFSVEWNEGMPTKTIDDENFYIVAQYLTNIASLSIPVYYYDSSSFNFSSLSDLTQLNNPIIDSDSIDEDATNNMYFKNFNISYSVSGLKDGNIVCYGDLNEYQKQHLDEFALTYTFNFEYYVYNPTVSGYKYNFSKNYSYQQTLSDFYSNGSSKVFTLKDIMQNINTQDVDSEYGNLYQLVSYLSNTGNNENIEYIWSKAKMKTTVFIVSASDSPSDILNSSNLHSNSFSKAYNFLDGKSSTYSDGITNNNNPYETTDTSSITDQNELNNMPDGVSSSNIPSSQADNGGSGTSVVTGDNNIVINNNPTFNNDGSVSGSGGGSSDGGVASTFYNTFNPFKTLFSSLNGDNSVISDETADSIGANRFISVMSSTFSFIPEGMWTALTTFFIASLSILVVAVVIRVLLDLL